MTVWRLAACVACALGLWPSRALAQQPVAIEPVVEQASVPAGSTARLALRLTVPPELHIQADRSRDPLASVARLRIEAPPGIAVVDLAFPASTEFRIEGLDEPQDVFQGEVLVGVRVRVDAQHAPGDVTLPAHLRYQACDESKCYPPRTIDTGWTFAVGAAGSPAPRAHAEVFRRIDFARAYAPDVAAPGTASPPAAAAAASAPSGDAVSLFGTFTVLNSPGSYMSVDNFLVFIHDAETGVKHAGPFENRGPLAILGLVFLGGIALNLTPCVLPMVPINLAIIGAGAGRAGRRRGLLLGAVYGGAMALVYGVLGTIVVLTTGTFGTLNASPWFNFGIAALFVVLGLAMLDVVFSIDFSKYSSGIRFDPKGRGTLALAFVMGAVAALLAGACVAPVVIQVIVFAGNLYARGVGIALALPFVLGVGMAMPWPIAGAGFAALPKPGAWMVRVKQVMGVFILATAAYYAYVGYGILENRRVDPALVTRAVEEQVAAGWHPSLLEGLQAARDKQAPALIDFWASWCKDCLAMDKTTLIDPRVKAALKDYVLIKVQAEDPAAPATKALLQRIGAKGLPAYAIVRPPPR